MFLKRGWTGVAYPKELILSAFLFLFLALLTQEELTAKMQLAECQISRSTLAKIESGICNIRISELKVMKSIFNASWDDLFFDI